MKKIKVLPCPRCGTDKQLSVCHWPPWWRWKFAPYSIECDACNFESRMRWGIWPAVCLWNRKVKQYLRMQKRKEKEDNVNGN